MSRLGIVICVLASLLVAGCTDAEEPATSTPTDAAPEAVPSAEVAWSITDGGAVSQISEAAPGIGVYYATVDGSLALRAVDLASGEIRWSVRVAAYEDAFLSPEVSGGRVGYLGPAKQSGTFRPSAIDVKSGKVTRSRTLVTEPQGGSVYACSGAEGFCFYGKRLGDEFASLLWFHGPALVVEDYWDAHGDEQYDGIDIEDTQVVRRDGGKTLWRQPRSLVFKGLDDQSYAYSPDPVAGTYEFSAGRVGSQAPLRARDVASIAIDAKTGRRLWIHWAMLGSRVLTADEDLRRTGEVGVFCRYQGLMESTYEAGSRAQTVALVGVHRRTGKQVWQVDGPEECSFPSNDGRIIYPRVGGRRIEVEVATGKRQSADEETVVWEGRATKSRVNGVQVTGSSVFEPRHNDSSLVEDLPWPLPEKVGAAEGAIHAVVIDGEVRGYQSSE